MVKKTTHEENAMSNESCMHVSYSDTVVNRGEWSYTHTITAKMGGCLNIKVWPGYLSCNIGIL